MKEGRSISDLAREIERQRKSARDFVADTRNLLPMVSDGKLQLIVTGQSGSFPVRKHAARQIGVVTGIPANYMERMLVDAPDLAAQNVAHWFQHKPERRMVRTLDREVRAFMSDRYQRIDNYQLAEVAFPVIAEEGRRLGLDVTSCEITESRLYIKAVTPRIHGKVKGEIVQAGLSITNSEIGMGAVSVAPFAMVLACLNGMAFEDSRFRRHHVGRHIEEEGDVTVYADDTRKADDRAILLKIRDVVRSALDESVFRVRIEKMNAAADPSTKLSNPVPAIEELSKTFTFSNEEQGSILRHLIEGADLSKWGVSNAVTRMSQEVASYDRASELEKIGGRLIELPESEWDDVRLAA